MERPRVRCLRSRTARADELEQLAHEIKDNNYRIFSSEGEIHLLGSRQHFSGKDPFDVFDDLMDSQPSVSVALVAMYVCHRHPRVPSQSLPLRWISDAKSGSLTNPRSDDDSLVCTWTVVEI